MKRKKTVATFTLDPDVIEALEAWLKGQDFPPSKSAVVEAALREFLVKRRYGQPGP